MRAATTIAVLAAATLAAAGCNLVLGIESAEEVASLGGGGAGGACSAPDECDDDNACTDDGCEAGHCTHEPLDQVDAPAEEQVAGDCQRLRCLAGEVSAEVDSSDLPVDGLECTEDRCSATGEPSNPAVAVDTPCAENGGALCDGNGACVECTSDAQCTDPESCGGGGTPGACGCTPVTCASKGLTCGFAAEDGCGKPLDCNDKAKNGVETDVDCGGSVTSCAQRCNDGKACQKGSDCANGVCVAAVCNSGVWARAFGGTGSDGAVAVAVSPSDDLVIVGDFNSTIDFGGGPLAAKGSTDVFVAGLDTFGNWIWSVAAGDGAEQHASGVAIDSSGSAIVVGRFAGSVDFGGGSLTSKGNTDIFVAKLDSSGKHLWSKSFGGAQADTIEAVAVDKVGNAFIAGSFGGTIDFGGGVLTSAGGLDAYLCKLSASGSHVWSKRLGSALDQRALALAAGSLNDVFVAGTMLGSVDFGAGNVTGGGGGDLFLAHYQAGGGLDWAAAYGDASNQCLGCSLALAVDVQNNVLLAGSVTGAVDFGGGILPDAGGSDAFVAKFAAGGAHAFSKRFGDSHAQAVRGVAVDGTGRILLCGEAAGAVDFGGGALVSTATSLDLFLVSLDGSGNHKTSALHGGSGSDRCFAVARDEQNKALVVGSFEGSLDLGIEPTLGPAAATDAFAAKLTP